MSLSKVWGVIDVIVNYKCISTTSDILLMFFTKSVIFKTWGDFEMYLLPNTVITGQ